MKGDLNIGSFTDTNIINEEIRLFECDTNKIKQRDNLSNSKTNHVDNFLKTLDFYFCGYTRYFILIISILCMTAARRNNSTSTMYSNIEMSPKEKAAVFSGSGLGAFIMVIPVVYAINHLGAKNVFSFLLFLSIIATISLAYLPKINVYLMVPMRVIQGLSMASVMPMMGYVSSTWTSKEEIGNFIALLSASGQFSQLLTMPLSAFLCTSYGWESVYIVHGLLGSIVLIIFLIFFRNTPHKHPFVCEKESKYITNGSKKLTKKEKKIPFIKIFKSKPVWGIFLAFLGNSFGFQIVVQFMPTYLNKVLNVSVTKTGLSSIIPSITQLVFKLLAGILSDRIKFLSEKTKIQWFNSIAMIGSGIFLLPLGFLNQNHSEIAIFCFTMSISLLGVTALGAMKSVTLIARSFTHFVMGIVQLVICIGMLLVPMLVTALAPNNTIEEWRIVYFFVFMALFLGNLAFIFMCSAEPQKWAIQNENNEKKRFINDSNISNE
ncbi:Major facilitator superfamily and Major facilitator superfamily domain, general substrate transporter and Major facilitator superfamily domain-containing protein [Strongyloides ratti]|uniref:Major facilitator superfamily and Major facilitator superfamily domain, general substrate transporter and Major facilitator superfamily domain-containing protein n=1 Tax=Strongyloides ratti TaxID=34506 RepID=A0A090KZT6_STRRB|nr:Major facilitator superfamily and Major facilitator superfamily domain, general substrate transporter and Major facilitator superfamily domain-containing protein [Strongyloides ratti]CEF63045.1 Major facilitator superfamily and Major facilitator superfamily domain, general substrate transporter and Major facilitator superfamily domain-containing protein [Strongyloides ratti]